MNTRIHITGGLGFIGSNLVRYLNAQGIRPIIYDRLDELNWKNVAGLSFEFGQVSDLYNEESYRNDEILIHLGASVKTTEPMNPGLWYNNVDFSLRIIKNFKNGKVIYASSAATYGAEESNFKERINGLRPLNAYGFTKLMLDDHLFGQSPVGGMPYEVYGLRFFNVYGPNETHKGDMQSVVSKAINKLPPLYVGSRLDDDFKTKHRYSLFASERSGVGDGEQKRDFVYVGDVCKVIDFFIQKSPPRGIYNLGSGKARSFVDLLKAVNPEAEINFVPMPDSLKGQYQYFTQADLTKLRSAGYQEEFTSLEDGVKETIRLTSG